MITSLINPPLRKFKIENLVKYILEDIFNYKDYDYYSK